MFFCIMHWTIATTSEMVTEIEFPNYLNFQFSANSNSWNNSLFADFRSS